MFQRIAQSALLPPAVTVAAAVVLGLVLAGGAEASSAPKTSAPKLPPPTSATSCWGTLKPAPTTLDPNLLAYQIHCDQGIIAYTIIGNRPVWDSGVIDDFDTSPVTTLGDGVTPDPRTSWLCEGSIPADGFNCTAGLTPSGTALSSMNAWSEAQGTVDTTDPYCGTPAASATKKKKSKKRVNPLTPTYPPDLSRASIQFVVTDWTGAQDGPFVLFYDAACHVKKPRTHAHHTHGDK